MKRKSVAFVTPGAFVIPSERGGSVERVVEKMTGQLASHIHPIVYGRTGARLPQRNRQGGVSFVRYGAQSKTSYFAAVKKSIVQQKPAIVQIENRPHVVKQFARIHKKVWLNLHSNTFIQSHAIRPQQLKQQLLAAHRIVVNSYFLRRDVIRRVPEVAHKVKVVYPGVDLHRFKSRFHEDGQHIRQSFRKEQQWNGRQVILFIGRLIPLKGAHHLLAVLPQIVAQHPNALFVIVGSAYYGSHRLTTYGQRLHQQAKSFRNHVQFVPYIPHHDVPKFMLAADMAVVPSGQREAFGLVNVEAMACGLPIVATKNGGMPEIIRDGETGYLIDPGHVQSQLQQKLNELLDNKPLRVEMGKKGRERVEKTFTWQHSAKMWRNIME